VEGPSEAKTRAARRNEAAQTARRGAAARADIANAGIEQAATVVIARSVRNGVADAEPSKPKEEPAAVAASARPTAAFVPPVPRTVAASEPDSIPLAPFAFMLAGMLVLLVGLTPDRVLQGIGAPAGDRIRASTLVVGFGIMIVGFALLLTLA